MQTLEVQSEAHSFVDFLFRFRGWDRTRPRERVGSLFPSVGDSFPRGCSPPQSTSEALAPLDSCFLHDDYWPQRGSEDYMFRRKHALECDDNW
eukprot:7148817-Prymnesium_polylepis.1